MSPRSREEFATFLHELLRPLGAIRLHHMFGGYGIYCDEHFFAVVVDEQLYLKTDAVSRPTFESAGLEEWIYAKDGKPVRMGYFRPPEEIYEDEECLRHWGRMALDAALRMQKPARPARKKSTRKRASQPEL